MKKNIIIFFILFSVISLFTTEKMKVLIMPLQNNSLGLDSDFISTIIQDSIKAEISSYTKFSPVFLEEVSAKHNVTDYKEIYKDSFDNKIDLIITGFYFEKDGKVSIMFKVVDVLTDRMKIVYENSGTSGLEILDLVRVSTLELLKKMDSEIVPYPEDISRDLRNKQTDVLSGFEKEYMVLFGVGINYSGLGIIQNETGTDTNDSGYQIASNKYKQSPVNPGIDFEIYGKYKQNYYGFALDLQLPFIFNFSTKLFRTNLFSGFNFGYLKEHIFNWSIGMSITNFEKAYTGDYYQIFNMNFGLAFNYRYLPQKYPFFVEGGIIIYPSFLQSLLKERGNSNGPKPFYITVNNYYTENSMAIPVSINIGSGYFFNNEFGIFIKNTLYFISMDNYFIENNDSSKIHDFGTDFEVGFDFSIGIIYKNIFK